jgi:hypothetical protein|tara:strand:- start:161 stop:532 length:372 start_codon:yes stop_codon:yes gene_type:complete
MGYKKYLYFMEQTDGAFDALADMACYPLERFVGFTSINATTLDLAFEPKLMEADSNDTISKKDSVRLTIVGSTHKAVIKSISDLIYGGLGKRNNGLVVIADNSNSIYADANITSCAVTVHAEA